jgi:hypothetical protein
VLTPPSKAAHSATAATSAPPASTAIEKLLRDLGPQLRRGHSDDSVVPEATQGVAPERARGRAVAAETQIYLPTGITAVDQLLGGGFPRGRLSEITGPASSGRTSLALALLAQTTRAGETTAVVDASDAFDPASAHSTGTLLDRVLWVRATSDGAAGSLRHPNALPTRGRAPCCSAALRSAERILKAHGFALLLLDLTIPNLRIPPATGPRLARAAASTGTALIIVTRTRSLGTAAEIAIELAPERAHFTGTPALLEGLEIRAALVRHRSAPSPRTTTVHLRTPQAAAMRKRRKASPRSGHADARAGKADTPRSVTP